MRAVRSVRRRHAVRPVGTMDSRGSVDDMRAMRPMGRPGAMSVGHDSLPFSHASDLQSGGVSGWRPGRGTGGFGPSPADEVCGY